MIKDYYLPHYICKELQKRDLFHETESSFAGDNTIKHLEITPPVIRCIAESLRRRRDELLHKNVISPGHLYKGLQEFITRMHDERTDFMKEVLDILPGLSGFHVSMIKLLLKLCDGLLPEAIDTESPPQNIAASRFVPYTYGYLRFFPGNFISPFTQLPWKRKQPVFSLHLKKPPLLIVNILAGNVPGIAITPALLASIVGAASLGKNSSLEPYFGPRFFSELARIETTGNYFPFTDLHVLISFSSRNKQLVKALCNAGDHIQAMGGDDVKKALLRLIKKQPGKNSNKKKIRLSGHWHKVSFDVIGSEMLTPEWMKMIAFNTAFDNSIYNTFGCLSAQQLFIEGSEESILRFAEYYIRSMKEILSSLPVSHDVFRLLRKMYFWYENKPGYTILTSQKDMKLFPFFVVYDNKSVQFSTYHVLNRSLIIRRISDLETDLPQILKKPAKKGVLQSCGIALHQSRFLRVAEILGHLGVSRVVPCGDIWNMKYRGDSWDGYLAPYDIISKKAFFWMTVSITNMEKQLKDVYMRNKQWLKEI